MWPAIGGREAGEGTVSGPPVAACAAMSGMLRYAQNWPQWRALYCTFWRARTGPSVAPPMWERTPHRVVPAHGAECGAVLGNLHNITSYLILSG